MFLLSRLLQAARMWRRRRGAPKTAKRPAVAVEQLDHRQLLSVNFTGNVAIDFPATSQPGVVIFNSTNTVTQITHPIIPSEFGLPSTSHRSSRSRASTSRKSVFPTMPRTIP